MVVQVLLQLTIVDADRIIVNDNGTMKQVAVSDLNTYTSSTIAADDLSVGDAACYLLQRLR